MSEQLAELLLRTQRRDEGRVFGVVTGVVTNNADPDGLGRVKVKFPWLSDTAESWWARVAAPMAGDSYGTYFLPEVDDEVLVAFEHGDVRFPYVLGALWNSNAKPPEDNSDQKNNHRSITSRSGHVVRLDDTDGEEKIEIVDKSGKNEIVFDTKNNAITINADSDVTISSANGKLKLSGNGVEITSQADVKVDASGDLKLTASGQANVKGSVINLN
jgi:uncharacterized protein involved in type VI secretion and phage assembly